MEERTRLSGINLFFLWFGAAVSVAEILTGGYLAELVAVKGLWAILLGHLAGTLLLVLAGLIGFLENVPAIMSTRISFGKQGSYLISVINILQLVGWTAIMIIEGGTAMNVIAVSLWHFNHPTLMSCLVGFLVGLWVFIMSGLAASMAGIMIAGRLASGSSNAGVGFELEVITAVVLGGTSLLGGRGSIAGTILGAVVLGVIANGLVLMHVSPFYIQIVQGTILLLAIFLNTRIFSRFGIARR